MLRDYTGALWQRARWPVSVAWAFFIAGGIMLVKGSNAALSGVALILLGIAVILESIALHVRVIALSIDHTIRLLEQVIARDPEFISRADLDDLRHAIGLQPREG